MNNLKQKYIKEVVPQMMAEFHLKNILAVPRLEKVTINAGIPTTKKDDKFLELVKNTLSRISGQKPVFTLARQAISAFKIRENQIVGAKVTLRGKRMYDFVDKLINISLPRIRDFRGIPLTSVDKSGNLTLGFKEHISFVEIDSSEVEMLHGLEICLTTNAQNKEKGTRFLKLLGFPFQN